MRSGILALFILCGWAVASVCGQSWTQCLDGTGSEPIPDWISPLSPENPEGVAAVSYEFLPSPERSGMLVTLLFDEVEGGFLRVFWKSGSGSVFLSQNLYEGIGLPNQRNLLIPQELLRDGGIITFQASSKSLNIRHIRWEWLKPAPMLSLEEQEAKLIGRLGVLLKESDVNGEEPLFPEDRWEKLLVVAQINEKPERIEEGVEFSVELESAPIMGRLEGKINGLDLKAGLLLWVNGQKVGLVYPEIPDLRDIGYRTLPGRGLTYLGWRKAAVYIPSQFLHAGINRFQFSQEDPEKEDLKPLALKELKLQLDFGTSSPKSSVGSSSEEELVR